MYEKLMYKYFDKNVKSCFVVLITMKKNTKCRELRCCVIGFQRVLKKLLLKCQLSEGQHFENRFFCTSLVFLTPEIMS